MAILLTGLYSIRSNRQLFAQLAALSAQRSELAQKLISTQESTLRHISRELHDEFGQILTAVGAMLSRAGNQVPEGSPLRAELREVAEIAQTTLDKVRSLSQALHPVMLEETGLESTLDWYLPVVERQAGIHISYEKSGDRLSRGWKCCYSCISRRAGSSEQRDAAFRRRGSLGAFAISCPEPWSWKWKITAAGSWRSP